ncbi:MAG: hypothetical protein RLZZ30_1843 [Bacteroidota bacterium]|jgi:hypothetical protein
MKKIVTLLSLFVVLVVLGWFAFDLSRKDGVTDSEYIEFAVTDTNSVSKIIITDAFSNKFTLVRKGDEWTDEHGGCIMQSGAHYILEALGNISLKGYLSEKSHKQFIKLMSASHTKVEIFQDGEWTKTWFIGPSSQDHNGQIMLLETAEDGKSANPVMMKIKGMTGIIEPRFFADPRKWACTKIFELEMDEIASVDVKYPKEGFRNFHLTSKGNRYTLTQNGRKLAQADTMNIYRYLQGYKKIHFELANYELSKKQCDSLKKTTPFCVLQVKEKTGKSSKLRMFKIAVKEAQRNEFGEMENMDMNKFWCELPSGELVKCQYFVFNPLIMGHVYFPAMEAQFPADLKTSF